MQCNSKLNTISSKIKSKLTKTKERKREDRELNLKGDDNDESRHQALWSSPPTLATTADDDEDDATNGDKEEEVVDDGDWVKLTFSSISLSNVTHFIIFFPFDL